MKENSLSSTNTHASVNPDFKDPFEYEYMLDACIASLKQQSKNRNSKENKLTQPILVREGRRKKKTSWTNFSVYCTQINRDPEHCSKFVINEINLKAGLTEDGQLGKSKFFGEWS